MDNTKIIFFDIDGTLIDMEKKCVTEKMLETLRRLQEKGIIICIATGRSPMDVPKFQGVEFDAIINFNGSYCHCGNKQIYSNPLRTNDIKTIIRNAAGINRPIAVATDEKVIANGSEKDLVDYFAIAKMTVDVSEDFDRMVEEDNVYQIMMGGYKEEYHIIVKDTENAKIAAWWNRAIDIIPKNVGKGIGVNKVLEYYGIDKSQAMAFGDGNNDIEMFEQVGHPIAMGNASDDLKAISEQICGHVAEDGIYYFCKENNLI